VFTDGEDNLSSLTAETAVLRAKTTGVPIYTVAQGAALHHGDLVKELEGVSQATGGLAFTIRTASEIGRVFDAILQDLMHGYFLAFQPPVAGTNGWRPIEVVLGSPRGRKVRAREGYYPE
jgi:hypothetical protein